ncbi:hypothetical protein COE51_01520 [Bacillus pseudomycoides]|nr:hypothetical protein COE51_01520 [Bacillus pseudomycoides]
MKFLLEDLKESIAWGEHWIEKDLYHIKTGKWEQEGKREYRDIIFKHKGKYYTYVQCRELDGEYINVYDTDENGYIKCEEYENVVL